MTECSANSFPLSYVIVSADHGDRLHPCYNLSAVTLRILAWNFGNNGVSAHTLDHADNCLVLSLSDDGVDLSVINFAARLNAAVLVRN